MSAIVWHGSISGALSVFPKNGLSVRGRSAGSFLEQLIEIEPVIWRAVELFSYSRCYSVLVTTPLTPDNFAFFADCQFNFRVILPLRTGKEMSVNIFPVRAFVYCSHKHKAVT